MVITSGEILGSYAQRIHSYPSEEILPDYFIQLEKREITKSQYLTEDGTRWAAILENSPVDVGNRVMISAYDQTLGLIYP
jgi:hypothetical protein